MPTHNVYIAVSAFDIVAIATVIGVQSCRLWIVPATAVEHLHKRLWRFLALSLVALTASSFVLLVGRTMEMSRQSLSHVWHWLPLVIRETEFGHIWLVRPAALVIMWAAWLLGRRPSRTKTASILMLLSVSAIAFTRSATGHPADQGQWTFPEWMDWLHLMMGSIWAGSLFVMTLTIFPALCRPQFTPVSRATLIKNLSTVAASALAGVLITGLWGAYYYVGDWNDLWHTNYGRTLLVKVALVLGAIALGALNRFLYVPAVGATVAHKAPSAPHENLDSKPMQCLARSVAWEAILLLAVLLTAAVLLHGMPPRSRDPNMSGNMAFAPKASFSLQGRLQNVTLTTIRRRAEHSTISVVRYGVLDFMGRRPYSTGPSTLIAGATSL
ncbi:MAG: copper resistance D family protein [Acidiferrobacter sp.]